MARMRKWTVIIAGVSCAVVGFILSCISLAGCAGTSIRHVSAEDFLKKANALGQVNSASWTTFVGCSPTRAYLESGDLFGVIRLSKDRTRYVVYWTELTGLPPEVSAKLKEGTLLTNPAGTDSVSTGKSLNVLNPWPESDRVSPPSPIFEK